MQHTDTGRPFVIRKIRFKEISDTVARLDGRSVPIRLTRLLIRYLTRLAHYRHTARVLGLTLPLLRWGGSSRTLRYIRHLVETNKIRLEYLHYLSNGDLSGAVRKKTQWAEIALSNSMSPRSRWNAKAYSFLLSSYGFRPRMDYAPMIATDKVSEKRFYLYGPNAGAEPDSKYEHHVLVLTKPISLDISAYRERLLFLNSDYYNNVVARNAALRDELAEIFGTIYVSCRNAVLSPPFVRSKDPMASDIAGPQGLGRLFYNLVRAHGTFSCVVEGFDLFLSQTAFGTYYPTLIRDEKGQLSEQAICCSLADHDALYNFLYLKEMVGMLDLVDSVRFRKVIDLTGDGYLSQLSRVRDFASLRYV